MLFGSLRSPYTSQIRGRSVARTPFRTVSPRTLANNTHSGRIELAAPAINTVGLDEFCLHTSGHLASILKRTMYLIGGFGRIVGYKRGRASATKEQPHREVGTQSHGPRL